MAVVAAHRWESLAPEQRKKFVPLCPDFTLELKSPSDSLKEAKQEMTEWIENGCCLAWLLDPENQTAHVYRPASEPEETAGFTGRKLSAAPVLPGFGLDLGLLT